MPARSPWRALRAFSGPFARSRRVLREARAALDVAARLTALPDAELGDRFRHLRPDGPRCDRLAAGVEVLARTDCRPSVHQIGAAISVLDGQVAMVSEGDRPAVEILALLAGAATGPGMHALTSDSVRARRRAASVGAQLERFGVTVGYVDPADPDEARRAAYGADVAFVAAEDAARDRLRDQLEEGTHPVLGERRCAVVLDAAAVLVHRAAAPVLLADSDGRPAALALVRDLLVEYPLLGAVASEDFPRVLGNEESPELTSLGLSLAAIRAPSPAAPPASVEAQHASRTERDAAAAEAVHAWAAAGRPALVVSPTGDCRGITERLAAAGVPHRTVGPAAGDDAALADAGRPGAVTVLAGAAAVPPTLTPGGDPTREALRLAACDGADFEDLSPYRDEARERIAAAAETIAASGGPVVVVLGRGPTADTDAAWVRLAAVGGTGLVSFYVTPDDTAPPVEDPSAARATRQQQVARLRELQRDHAAIRERIAEWTALTGPAVLDAARNELEADTDPARALLRRQAFVALRNAERHAAPDVVARTVRQLAVDACHRAWQDHLGTGVTAVATGAAPPDGEALVYSARIRFGDLLAGQGGSGSP